MKPFSYWATKTVTTTVSVTVQRQLHQQHHPHELINLNLQLAKLTRSSQYNDALHLFDQIHSLHHGPRLDHYTLSTTLTACANIGSISFGNQLHAYAVKAGLKASAHIANTLVSLYAKVHDIVSAKWVFEEIENPDVFSYTTLLSACWKQGNVDYAWDTFDKTPQKDVAVWNAMIKGCIDSGNEEIGFALFREMWEAGVRCDRYGFASVLSGCYLEFVDFGRQMHSLVVKTGYLAATSVVNALISMYFNNKNTEDAYLVFEVAQGSVYDHITYNVMISGFVATGKLKEALKMFKNMLETYLRPTELTFVSLMSSCLCARDGSQAHAQVIKMGFEACTVVSNAAISMYTNCKDLRTACKVFERLEEKDLVSWNTIISSYAQGNFGRSAISAYLQMQRAGFKPDEFTFGSLLASSEFIETVEMVQAIVFRNGLDSNVQVSNALVSAYSKHGDIFQAYQIFCNLFTNNLISWNTMISGFLLNGLPLQGLKLFSDLLMSEIRPDEYTLTITLSICASISALRHGKQVHCYIITSGFALKRSLGNALMTMYNKCGFLEWSLRVFNAMTERDVVSWNALISAYAQHGQGKEAMHCFEAMQNSPGVEPDQATLTAVLSACSHAGLVNDGTRIFNSMVSKYGVAPGIDHFSCVVDLLGRAGHFDEVERIINSEHFEAHPSIWWTLFSACVAHGNLKLGRLAAGFLVEMEKNNPSVYVLSSNIYASAGQWEEAANVRQLINDTGAMKQPGCSWIS